MYASMHVATITAANTVIASINIHSFEVRAEFLAAAPVVSSIHSDEATVAETLCQKSDVAMYDLINTQQVTGRIALSHEQSEE